MTQTTNRLYSYTVNTDAGLTRGIMAQSMDDAARLWAAGEPNLANLDIETVDDLIEAIEAIDGAWLWIEAVDHPSEIRHYAGSSNMA